MNVIWNMLLSSHQQFRGIAGAYGEHNGDPRLYRLIHIAPMYQLLGWIFTALHVMQARYCDENSACLSVCLSVTRVYCDKTVERSVQIYIPYERTFSLVF